ncbi:hypothetical protein QTI66_21500 [Variovorax sp. J22R133]|uniref:hypothetical protein n=1 Tax=Variovorax brevis TaxID=3053503 RepID=UPI002578E0F0|nr:hypothetical protein [Variovorax sp. J22R133]MDM0114743.1 hypothetical protein [Variovorax sp. J22R133]
MQPAVEITKRGETSFDAQVGIGSGAPHYEREGLPSLAACLRDAAEALGDEFPVVTVVYQRIKVGSFPVAAISHRACEVAEELLSRTAGHPA